MTKYKSGRPKIKITEKEKGLAIQYVTSSGLYKNRLAAFIGIGRKTLYRVLARDKDFDTQLKRADAQFCANIIQKAKPDFILKTKYRDEFVEKVGIEHSIDERLEKYLDKQSHRLP